MSKTKTVSINGNDYEVNYDYDSEREIVSINSVMKDGDDHHLKLKDNEAFIEAVTSIEAGEKGNEPAAGKAEEKEKSGTP